LGLAVAWCAPPAVAHVQPEDPEYQALVDYQKEVEARSRSASSGRRGATPFALPDIFGAGSVLNVGNVVMKVTNFGFLGNPTTTSSDPSGQWPGTSGVEYLDFCQMAMGAVNPFATDPNAVRRVSLFTEWRPATLASEDRMYRSYDGIVNGLRFTNDDGDRDPLTGDARIDEDFLDGRDNDGDGRIDEDFAAIGQQMYTCVIRDDTPQAVAAGGAERHVPLGGDVGRGVECRQSAWAYSIPGFTDFDVVNWHFFNRSGHELDSVVIGFFVDFDAGPADKSGYFNDDFDANMYPFGHFIVETKPTDGRLQRKGTHPPVPDAVDADSALCPRFMVTVQGFSIADDDGDEGKTLGIPSFMLIDHTIDPTGVNGPTHVGFRAFRSYPRNQPFVQGGGPTIDQQRFELMTGHDNVSSDPSAPGLLGFIDQPSGDQRADYRAWASIGPWLRWPADGDLECTFAIGVRPGSLKLAQAYAADYLARATQVRVDPNTGEPTLAVTNGAELVARYPSLDNAIAAQLAFEGAYESRSWPVLTDFPGRETAIKAPPGQRLQLPPDCRRQEIVFVDDQHYSWFDSDCDYCTGAYSSVLGQGLFHHTWLAESPPPSPGTNLGVTYNYTDNPDRRFPPAGDGQVTIAWDNMSENTPDPKTGWLDFRGYKIWKVSDWTRPVGATGPAEDDWTLLAEYRLFNHAPDNKRLVNGVAECPNVYIPQKRDSVRLCLVKGDLWNLQSGDVLHPDPALPCVGYPNCVVDSGFVLGSLAKREGRTRYPVGRYHYVDHDVKNGFLYFYSVTAFDSTGVGGGKVELNGRHAAVEAEGVTPQSAANRSSSVWVVPNPYRGVHDIQARPSAWDLTPNGTDPTGTHIDFLGLPDGPWSIKIFTLSGDLVQTLHSGDAVDAAVRNTTAIDSRGQAHDNVTRQQDTPADGQARWNLISRNGQDIVSGIYLFTVSSKRGNERGRFVVIR
jgi:hypothetical protein